MKAHSQPSNVVFKIISGPNYVRVVFPRFLLEFCCCRTHANLLTWFLQTHLMLKSKWGLSASYLSLSWGVVYRIPSCWCQPLCQQIWKNGSLKVIFPDRPEDTYQSYVRGLNPSASINQLPSKDPNIGTPALIRVCWLPHWWPSVSPAGGQIPLDSEGHDRQRKHEPHGGFLYSLRDSKIRTRQNCNFKEERENALSKLGLTWRHEWCILSDKHWFVACAALGAFARCPEDGDRTLSMQRHAWCKMCKAGHPFPWLRQHIAGTPFQCGMGHCGYPAEGPWIRCQVVRNSGDWSRNESFPQKLYITLQNVPWKNEPSDWILTL